MSKKICFVEPLSSANYLSKRLQEEEFFSICIRLNKNPGVNDDLLEKMRGKIDYQQWNRVIDFDYEEGHLDDLAQELKALGVEHVYYGCEYVISFTDILGQMMGVGYNNPKSAEARSNKYAMQEALSRSNCDIPKQRLITNEPSDQELAEITADIKFPLVLKPTNAMCSIGVQVINGLEELKKYNVAQHVKSYGSLVAQQKITGDEYFVDTFSVDGKHQVSLVAKYEKEVFKGDFLYRTITALTPGDSTHTLVSNYLCSVLDALELKHGFGHSELFLTQERKPFLIEVNARISGMIGTANELAMLTTGEDQVSLISKALKNVSQRREATTKYNKVVFVYNFIEDKKFHGIHLNKLESLPSYHSHALNKKNGADLAVGGNLLDSYVYIILASNDLEQFNQDYETIRHFESSGELLV